MHGIHGTRAWSLFDQRFLESTRRGIRMFGNIPGLHHIARRLIRSRNKRSPRLHNGSRRDRQRRLRQKEA
jgi:hypothetical protein